MPDQPFGSEIEIIRLVAGGQDFGVEVAHVREIRRWVPVTPIPHAPDYLLGVMNLRGAVIPVFDLALRLGLARTVPTCRHVITIVSAGDRSAGLLVEVVTEILRFPVDRLQRVPPVPRGGLQLLKGMLSHEDGALRILDIDAVAPVLAEQAA